MTIWGLAFILGCLAAVFLGFVWVAVKLNSLQGGTGGAKKAKNKTNAELDKDYNYLAEEDVNHIFNKEFREELRNKGRLRFEKIVDENAMFLKQDLDLTISQLNEYMKQQVSSKLDSEFQAYAKAMKEAQELTLAALQKTAAELDSQRRELSDAMQKSATAREAELLKSFEANMAKIVEYYVMQSLGEQFDMRAQLPYIMKQMEDHKKEMMEDMLL